MPAPPPPTFRQVLAAAIAEISASGYVSPERIEEWITKLRNAAERELGPEAAVDRDTQAKLDAIFHRLADAGRIVEYVPDVSRLNIAMVRPQLRAELDRRILAAADLNKVNRREAVEKTLQRFRGYSTSIPPGGDGSIDKREVISSIGMPLAKQKYHRRLVDNDQGHKLLANISSIVAVDAGAIAAKWHSHGEHDRSYDARKEHLARVGKVYAIRDCWAMQQGLMNKGDGYLDDMDQAGQKPHCRCWCVFLVSPRRLPPAMLNEKGREWVERGRLQAERMSA